MPIKKKTEKAKATDMPNEIRKLVHQLDDLYYKKPAGFFGYVITCMSTLHLPSGMLRRQKADMGEIK